MPVLWLTPSFLVAGFVTLPVCGAPRGTPGVSRIVSCKYKDGHIGAPGSVVTEPPVPTISERMPLYCVPIPALTPWAARAAQQDVNDSISASSAVLGGGKASNTKAKRERDDDGGSATPEGVSPVKRAAADGDGGKDDEDAENPDVAAVNASFPLQLETDLPCIVYVRSRRYVCVVAGSVAGVHVSLGESYFMIN